MSNSPKPLVRCCLRTRGAWPHNHSHSTAIPQTTAANDLGGPKIRGLFDCAGTVGACAHALDHIDNWAREEHVKNDLFSSSTYVRREPKGVVLIIAPWNYPVELTFHPLVYALAAGNCVVIKPSEVSASCPPVIRQVVETFVHALPSLSISGLLCAE